MISPHFRRPSLFVEHTLYSHSRIKIVEEAIEDGDFTDEQGQAIIKRVNTIAKEAAGGGNNNTNPDATDAATAAGAADGSVESAVPSKKRFSIFGGGKTKPPPPPPPTTPPPPPKSDLGLSIQDLEGKFTAAAGSDAVLNKSEFKGLVSTLMKGAPLRPSEKDLDAAFELADADKSGTVKF